ncbi:MAG: type I-U CRISPR-associated RAMP protein Csb1/Cas7u [Thermoplasmata archaeon]|nr:type I-U CRISPR-associated RAMP protein Csb1/Cas7u [Thermoplasmata archaeon]
MDKDKGIKMVTKEMMDRWATDPKGPVALHLKQKLISVEGEGGIIFPPTYANIGYNIDEEFDGKMVVTIDSVGSQANRIEPLFKEGALKDLVPQIEIRIDDGTSFSILDVGHRLGDALVRCTNLSTDAKEAFKDWLKGDALKLAKLAPTSIVFGVWDSRDTAAKLPRIIQSVIRAWDVKKLRRSATYIPPPVDYAGLEVFSEEDKAKAERDAKSPLAQRGFVHDIQSAGSLGGVLARGPIYRDITVNLIALRRLNTSDEKGKDELHKYILGLSLVAATQPVDGFLRQGCLLTLDPAAEHTWALVMRDGTRQFVDINGNNVLEYAKATAKVFGIGESKEVKFDKKKAKEVLQKDKKKKKGKDKENNEGKTDG